VVHRIRGIGVIKASLGVQTFDPRVQAAIGRVQPEADIARAMDGLRAPGVDSINFDLMYGLPHQDEAVLAQTLDTAVAMAPDRVALFGYAHVPHVVHASGGSTWPRCPASARFAMAAQGSAHCARRATTPSVSITFARPHDAWPRRGAMARCGAISRALPTIPRRADRPGASSVGMWPGLLVQNEKNAGRYRQQVEAGRLAGTRGLVQSAEDQRRAALIEALLCQEAVDLPADIREAIAPDLAPFLARGLARLEGRGSNSCPAARPITARSRCCSMPIADKAISSVRRLIRISCLRK
jgi:oxygen-independent coproporphyrinogen-3 oxidase